MSIEETVERLSLLGSLSLERGGERDYYPLLNAMDGIFLWKTWGNIALQKK